MNPNSSYYLAINTGFPNAYDKANGRSGAFLMIHGDCSSRGCYAMTDEQIGEIYSLAREVLPRRAAVVPDPGLSVPHDGGEPRAAPHNPNMPFWKMIKEGNDHFEVTHHGAQGRRVRPPLRVRRRSRRPIPPNRLPSIPTGHCPAFEVSPQLAALARDKQQHDEASSRNWPGSTLPVAPIKTGTDGGMNRVFMAQIENSSRTVDSEGHVHVRRCRRQAPCRRSTGAVADDSAPQPSLASRLFGGMFGSKNSGNSTRVASADASATATQERSGGFFRNLFSSRSSGSSSQQANPAGAARAPKSPAGAAAASQKSKPATHSDTHTEVAAAPAGVRAKPRIEAEASAPQRAEPQPQKMEPQETVASKPKPAAQQEANAAAPAKQRRHAQRRPTRRARRQLREPLDRDAIAGALTAEDGCLIGLPTSGLLSSAKRTARGNA